MKDRFRQIIENADGNYVETNPERINVMLSRDEKLSAATNCEALAVEMMEKFAEWLAINEFVKRDKTHPKHAGKWWSYVLCEYFTTRELIAKFLSDYTHNPTRETI